MRDINLSHWQMSSSVYAKTIVLHGWNPGILDITKHDRSWKQHF